MEKLISEIKSNIIKVLNLEDMSVEDFDSDAALFGEDGIGLDSIDALEIFVMLEKNYGVRLTNAAEDKSVLKNVRSIAEYVALHRKK